MTQWLGKSYTGLMLCRSCWNTQHNHRAEIFRPCKEHRQEPDSCKQGCANGKFVKTSQIIIDCEGIGCQCPCRELLKEKHPKVKPDYSQQMTIAGVSTEGAQLRRHKDDN